MRTAEQQVAASAFARQMALEPDPGGPGRYRVELDPRWNCPVVPQGGVMAAVAARAMTLELDMPGQRLRSLTTVFAAQVPPGPATVEVSVLRRGRTMSQAVATVRAEGAAAGHTTVAVFGTERGGFEFTDLAMPDVPGPAECPSFRDPPPPEAAERFARRQPFAFWEHVEGRPASGRAPWDDEVMPTSSACASWYRFDEPPMLPDGRLDPLAVVALCDLMPSSVGQRMGPGTPEWYPPSADLTVHLLGEARSDWLLADLRARRATQGYASVEAALWDPTDRSLVAHATQLMFLTFPGGPPTGDLRLPADRRRG
ncbi:MAG TPA: thioesterase family protein [Acidimicrobiales bacterium]